MMTDTGTAAVKGIRDGTRPRGKLPSQIHTRRNNITLLMHTLDGFFAASLPTRQEVQGTVAVQGTKFKGDRGFHKHGRLWLTAATNKAYLLAIQTSTHTT